MRLPESSVEVSRGKVTTMMSLYRAVGQAVGQMDRWTGHRRVVDGSSTGQWYQINVDFLLLGLDQNKI